jgi:hypothetical protein
MTVAEHVWEVINERRDDSPYKPERSDRGRGTEVHPCRKPSWLLRRRLLKPQHDEEKPHGIPAICGKAGFLPRKEARSYRYLARSGSGFGPITRHFASSTGS